MTIYSLDVLLFLFGTNRVVKQWKWKSRNLNEMQRLTISMFVFPYFPSIPVWFKIFNMFLHFSFWGHSPPRGFWSSNFHRRPACFSVLCWCNYTHLCVTSTKHIAWDMQVNICHQGIFNLCFEKEHSPNFKLLKTVSFVKLIICYTGYK